MQQVHPKEPLRASEDQKLSIIITLSMAVIAMNVYAHYFLGFDKVFPHFFYVPLVLSGFWYGRRTIWLAVGFTVVLLGTHVVSELQVPVVDDLTRSVMFIIIGTISGVIGEFTIKSKAYVIEARDYLENIFDHASAPIIVWGGDQKITRFNQGAEHLTGYDANEIVGQPVEVLFPKESRENALAHIRFATSLIHPDMVEIALLHKNGSKRIVLWSFAAIHSSDGQTAIGTIAQGQDITDRVQAEEVLRHNQEYLKLALEGTDDCIWNWDVVTGAITLDEKWATQVLGYEQGRVEFDLEWWKNTVDPASLPVFEKALDDYLSGSKELMEFEYKTRTKHGDWKWVWARGKCVAYDRDNKPLKFSGTHRDVTERKMLEEYRRESEEKFRTVAEYSPDLIFILQDNKVAYINKTAEQMLGYTRQEFHSHHFDFIDAFTVEDKPRLIKNYQSQLEGNDQSAVGYMMQTKSGCHIDVLISTKLIDYNGKKAILGIITDITRLKHAESAAIESEESYRTLSQNQPGIVYRVFIQEKSRMQFMNDNITTITGYTVEELNSGEICGIEPLMLEEDRHGVVETVKQSIAKAKPFEVEYRIRNKDGIVKWLSERGQPVIKDGVPVYIDGVIFDITENKEAKEALKQERDMAQKYLDIAGVMIVAIDADQTISMVNKKGCQVLGYENELELIGKNWFDTFIPEDVRDEVKGVFKKMMTGDVAPVEYYENEILTKDGRSRLIAWHNEAIKNDDGDIIATVSSGEDITERKIAENKLKSSEERFRKLARQLPSMVFINNNGRITYVNDRCVEISGYSREEFYSPDFDFSCLMDNEEMKLINDRIEGRTKGMEYAPFEHTLIRKDGSRLQVISNNSVFLDEGNPVIIGVVTDISDLKKTEQALVESEERYRNLVEYNPDAIAIHSEGKVVFVNKAGVELLGGKTTGDIVGRKTMEFVHPDYRQVVKDRMGRTMNQNGVAPLIEEKFIRLDGEPLDVEVTAAPLLYEGKQAMQAVIRDVTERKRAEAALEKAKNLLVQSEKMTMAGTISCGIGHELTNPLMGIGGYLYEIKKNSADSNITSLAQRALSETKRCSKIINDLMLVCHPQQDLDLGSKVDCRKILAECEERHRQEFMEKGIEYMVSVEPDTDLSIIGNETYLDLILDNLIVNAIDAMDDVAKKRLHIDIKNNNDQIMFSVIDSGIGIEHDKIEKVLESFYTEKGPNKGTGLGLAICASLIKSWGGEMKMFSNPGVGTSVIVSLPMLTMRPKKEMEVRK